MKKKLLLIVGLWLFAIYIVIAVIFQAEVSDQTYRININRIHNCLGSDWQSNQQLIAGLSSEAKGMISTIELLDLSNYADNDYSNAGGEGEISEEDFFAITDIYKTPVIYLPIKGSSYLVKYSIKTGGDKKIAQITILCSLITILFLFFVIGIIYIDKRIIQQMKRLSQVPAQLASGHIDKLTIDYRHQYFKDFIWGLDMLREQLQEERNRNFELEKQRKTLVAGLSHDIKTPLSSIKNYTIALKEGVYQEAAEQKKAYDVILDKTEIIEKLCKELLDTSQQVFSTNNLKIAVKEIYMSDITQRLNQIIEQKIDLLHIDYQPPELQENLMVLADLDALSQVFDNIVENAVKYGDQRCITVSYHQEDYCQCIVIENTGKLIAANEIKHVFSSYYRGSNVNNQPGYGLGLYICQQLMKAMEGDIYARNSEAGVQIVVVIRLAGSYRSY